jgi:asparagine synthase (glutamine-hydrolysing)
MYRYIALLDNGICDSAEMDNRLRDIGLRPRPSASGFALYVSADTPVLDVAGGGALIGHVFSRDGRALLDGAELVHTNAATSLARHLIDHYWGEYLLLHVADGDEGRLSVLRDPSGGVDCVHALQYGFLTSDISIAIHANLFAKDIDWAFIGHALRYPHLKTGRTGLTGLRELLPGHRLDIRAGVGSIAQAWSPWDFVAAPRRHRDRHEAQAQVRHAVTTATIGLAQADAAVLMELSGGLDSSIIAACLKHAAARVSCCNLVTPVPGADERRYAQPMADLLHAELHVQTLGFEEAQVDFPPPAHAVAPCTWFLQHASNALKEAIGKQLEIASFFSGGGGDTVFCYTRTAAPAADALRECGMRAGMMAVHDLAELHQCTVWKAGRLTLKKLFAPPKPPRRAELSFLATTHAHAMLETHPWFDAPTDALPGDRERIFDLAGTQVFRDGLARGTAWQLRMPLLSQPVVEACLRVPSWMWIHGGRNRAVARDAFADVLPAAILHRRSKGTFMNYSGAVYRRNRHKIRDHLLDGRLAGQGLLDADALRRHFDRDLAAGDDSFMRIFDLCAAENWVRHQA